MARGSIVERCRANGETAFAIKYRTGDGTQVFRTIGTDRRAAERALTAALAAVDRGDLNGVTRETFGGYAERWLALILTGCRIGEPWRSSPTTSTGTATPSSSSAR